MRTLAIAFTLSVLAGCVTEGGDDSYAAAKEGPGPVERAQAKIEKIVARLPSLYGRRLLGTMQELIGYRELSVGPVLAALPAADERTQANLIYVLGFIGGDAAHDGVIPFLESRQPAIRYEAAAALVSMGDWGGVPVLFHFMESADRRERYKASVALKLAVKQDFGYQFDAPVTERERALQRWRSWWTGRREALIYGAPRGGARGTGKGN